MEQLPDKGYIVVGNTYDSYLRHQICLLKTDSLGNTLWKRVYKDTVDKIAYCVRQTKDGGYIMTGELSTPYNKLLLMKTDSLGDTMWTKTYYGPQEGEGGQSVLQTEDEGYIIVGSTNSYDPGPGYDVWLVRTDSLGDTLWTRTYGGKQGCDYGYWIEKTYDGGYIIAAMNWSSAPHNIWLIKIDSLGDTLWTKLYGSEKSDYPSCVKQTSDSGYIIIGHAKASGYDNVWLIKTNSYGDTLWTKFFLPEGSGIWNAGGECVQETYDGGYIITGSLIDSGYVKLFLTKTDSSGNESWTKKLSGIGYWVLQAPDSGYTVTGTQHDLLLWHIYKSVGIEEQKNELTIPISLKIYPNPVTYEALITCKTKNNFEPQLKLYDLSGREIYKFKTIGNQIRWRIPEELSSGYYFLRLTAGTYKEVVKVTILK